MTGTFRTKTRVYTSPALFTPISGRKSFTDSAIEFRRGLIENSSMSTLNADIAVKAAMGAGLSSGKMSIGQTSQGAPADTDGKKRVNKGGVPGMEEDLDGFRYMPDASWGPGKVLKLFPSREERQSSNKLPNFGFIDKPALVTPEEFIRRTESEPVIRMSKYKINTRTGEPIEDTEVELDRMNFGKPMDMSPATNDEVLEKSLGRSLSDRMPGGKIVARAAARFGVIMDELGKMRCPPGTPAANQFTDMTGSNCFGVTPGNMISEAIELSRRLIPSDDQSRTSGWMKNIVNTVFDVENGMFGSTVHYYPDGQRMPHGAFRKYRDSGSEMPGERWMVNGALRVEQELDAQDARLKDLYEKLGIPLSKARRDDNSDVFEAIEELRKSGVTNVRIDGRPDEAAVTAMMETRLRKLDPRWSIRSDEERAILLKIDKQRYRELERGHLEAFLDEVIKNPDHMKGAIQSIRFNPQGKDRASYGIDDIKDGRPIGSIDIDIPQTMSFQESMIPNMQPDERMRFWAEGGASEASRAMAVKDFLVSGNAYAGQMMAMVDGGRGLGRHDMKHEIAHSIQAAAMFGFMKSELDSRGSLVINRKDLPPLSITDVNQLDSKMLMALMMNEEAMGIDLEALKSLRSRADIVKFMAGRYATDVEDMYGGKRVAAEIGAELWALRSSGLVFGDDVDAALEYMDDIVSGSITADRTTPDRVLTERIKEGHLDGLTRIREARAELDRIAAEKKAAEAPSEEGFFDAEERASVDRMSIARESYAAEKRAEIKETKEAVKTMSEEDLIEFIVTSTELSDGLSEVLELAEEAEEEADWKYVMDRDTLDVQAQSAVDAWAKRFTVKKSPEAMEKLQEQIDDRREARGTLSPEKAQDRLHRDFIEGATTRSEEMDLDELVQHNSDWEELSSAEGVDADERARRKSVRDMYRDEYIKRRTEGPDSVSKEDARKEFNAKVKELRKPKTLAEKKRQEKSKAKAFKSHNGKDGARTFGTQERSRALEAATSKEKIAFVEMGNGETDVISMMSGSAEGMAAARAIQRRNTRLKKNGILPDSTNMNEASLEEQVENFYIPLLELMDKTSTSQTIDMYVNGENADEFLENILNGGPPDFTSAIGSGKIVTDKTDFSDGKKIIIRVPEGSRALFPDWSFYSDSDDKEQGVIIPPSKLHLVEVKEDGTVVLEIGEQMGTEDAMKLAVNQIRPETQIKPKFVGSDEMDWAYREGTQRKVKKITDRRIAERHAQGMFDPDKRSSIEEERFSSTADNASAAAGFEPDSPPRPTTPTPANTSPSKPRGLARKRATAAIERAKDYSRAQQELDAVNAFITGEGAYQNRTNTIGIKVGSIMERNFGTRNISELTEEQKYDLIDLISEAISKSPADQQRGLSQAKSRIQDHIDISQMVLSNNYSDPYGEGVVGFLDLGWDKFDRDNRPIRLSSGAKWGSLASDDSQIAGLLSASNNDGFNEIYGPPQTREERISEMVEMQSGVVSSLREMIDNVPDAGKELGLDKNQIDPYVLDFIKNSTDEEIYKAISDSAMSLHTSFDARPRVRMRQDELDKFVRTGRYGREGSFDTNERLSSGRVSNGIRARAKSRAIDMIAERIGSDEDSREIAEIVLETASAFKYGPQAALTKLSIELGKRGSREIAERTVQELVERGRITEEQAKSIMDKVSKFAPDGLPEPLKRGIGNASRAAVEAAGTPENRERLSRAREAAGDVTDRAREAVGEGARNIAERGRERLTKLRSRNNGGELPSTTEDVPFGDFDPADSSVARMSSGQIASNRRLDRRVAVSDASKERIMDGAKKTRTRFSSGEVSKPQPKKPFKPREPDNGPMTGKFLDIFRGAKSYQEILDRYNSEEVIFFDYETTGLDHNVEKPVQMGAVKMKGGKVVERFNVFVNPEKELSDWSKENLKDIDGNPLTDEWLRSQPSIKEGHEQMLAFFGPNALLGGQYTPFDLNFLEKSLADSGLEYAPGGVIDSKALADELLPRWKPDAEDGPFALNADGTKYASNSLGPLSEYLKVQLDAWHTADADSEASAMIVQKILEKAATDESIPKHLINVDNIPGIVTERRAKYKLAMDKYESAIKDYEEEIKALKATESADVKNLRSPGLKDNRDRPISEYGMDWKPEYSEKEWLKPAKDWDGWEDVPTTEVDLSSEILPTESHLKGSSIDKVTSGEEPLRDGYYPNLIIDTDGQMYISDGHNRVAMNRALGKDKIKARVVDLRKEKAPWEKAGKDNGSERLSSGESARSNKPKRVKKYKGYELSEPDNPTPKSGEYPDDVVEAATQHREKIEKVESEITQLLIDLAEKNDARMEGLDFRLKSLKSLMRKIAAEKDSEHAGDAKKAADSMSDVARYTMAYEPDNYIDGVKDVVDEMQKLGYELRIKNYWKGGDPYQGINIAVTHPDGTNFELQFHTPQSVTDKEKIHLIYEDYRKSKNAKERFKMYDRMVRIAAKINVPPPTEKLLEIGIVKEQPFTER